MTWKPKLHFQKQAIHIHREQTRDTGEKNFSKLGF